MAYPNNIDNNLTTVTVTDSTPMGGAGTYIASYYGDGNDVYVSDGAYA